jgi:hypothetical protein
MFGATTGKIAAFFYVYESLIEKTNRLASQQVFSHLSLKCVASIHLLDNILYPTCYFHFAATASQSMNLILKLTRHFLCPSPFFPRNGDQLPPKLTLIFINVCFWHLLARPVLLELLILVPGEKFKLEKFSRRAISE